MKWESAQGGEGAAWAEGFYPHVYFESGRLGLRRGEVEGVVEVVSREGEEGWEVALSRVGEFLV